jgi:hypothetical protein
MMLKRMTTERWMVWASVPLVAGAAILLLLGGFITVWDSDAGEDVFITRIVPSASVVLIASALACVACVVALRKRRALWIVIATALSAALLAIAIRTSVVSDAADVNDYIAVEGGTGGISSPITRAISGPITNVDPDIISMAWSIAAAMLTAGAALAGWSIWFGRRGKTHA